MVETRSIIGFFEHVYHLNMATHAWIFKIKDHSKVLRQKKPKRNRVNDVKPVQNIKNDLEMTFHDLKMTLRSKTTTSLLLSWKNLQKMSKYRCSNSYNSLDIEVFKCFEGGYEQSQISPYAHQISAWHLTFLLTHFLLTHFTHFGWFRGPFCPLRPNSGVTNNRECLKLL